MGLTLGIETRSDRIGSGSTEAEVGRQKSEIERTARAGLLLWLSRRLAGSLGFERADAEGIDTDRARAVFRVVYAEDDIAGRVIREQLLFEDRDFADVQIELAILHGHAQGLLFAPGEFRHLLMAVRDRRGGAILGDEP